MENNGHYGERGGTQTIIVDNVIDDDVEASAGSLNGNPRGEEQRVPGSDSGSISLDHHAHPYLDQDEPEDSGVVTSDSVVRTADDSSQADAPSFSQHQHEDGMMAVDSIQIPDLEEGDDDTSGKFEKDYSDMGEVDECSQDRNSAVVQPEFSTPDQNIVGKEFHSEYHPSVTSGNPLYLKSSGPDTSCEQLTIDLYTTTEDMARQNRDPAAGYEQLTIDLNRATEDMTRQNRELAAGMQPDDLGWSVTGKKPLRDSTPQGSFTSLAGLTVNLANAIHDGESPKLNKLACHLEMSIEDINQEEKDEMDNGIHHADHYLRPKALEASGDAGGAGNKPPNKMFGVPLLSDLERAWNRGQCHTNPCSPVSPAETEHAWGMKDKWLKDIPLALPTLNSSPFTTLTATSIDNSQIRLVKPEKSVDAYDRASQEQAGWGSLEDVDFVIPWYTRVGRVTMCFLFPAVVWFILWRWLNWMPKGIPWADFLSASFMVVEGISLGFASTSWLWMWNLKYRKRVTMEELNITDNELPTLDVLVPCYSEPPEIVEMTLRACYELDYPAHKVCVWICDDGKSDEMKAMVEDAKRVYTGAMQTRYVARIKIKGVPHHAKAGNLNNVIMNEGSTGQIIMVLDCDMLPEPCFPRTIAPFFFKRLPEGTPKFDEEGEPIRAKLDPDMGLIQTPQAFYNIDRKDLLGQNYAFFYECVVSGWDGSGCTPCCGTGVVFARPAMEALGGFSIGSITEDFKTSLNFCANGYKCKYYLKRMTRGVAPKELNAFMIQRMRWAVGSVQILKAKNPLFTKGLPWRARLLYFFSTIGCIYVLFIALIMGILYFAILTGAPLSFGPIGFMHYMAVGAIPIFLGSSMQFVTSWRLSWNDYIRGMQDNFNVFWTLLRSMVIGFCNLKLGFAVTSKDVSFDLKVNLYHAMPHIVVYVVSIVAMTKGTVELLAAHGYFSIPWTTDHNVDMIYFSWFWTLFLWYMISGVPRMVWYGYRRSKKEEASAKRGVYCTNANVPALQELPSSPMGTFPPLETDLVSFANDKIVNANPVEDPFYEDQDKENDRIANAMLQAKLNEEVRILNEAMDFGDDI